MMVYNEKNEHEMISHDIYLMHIHLDF